MTVITETKQLKEYIDKLSHEKFVTVDTEFLREKTYYPKLCLIQVAGEDFEFAIDPLAEGLNMQSFWDLMDNEDILKIFHACGQDCEIIVNEHGKLPSPLFDTQIAAKVLGYGEAIGYGNLVDKLLGRDIDKSSRFTDWSQRPLSEKQIEYAISDVTHLRDVYISLVQELEEKQRLHWAEEEMRNIADENSFIVNPDEIWRKIKTRGGQGAFLTIVKELAKWRELRAQKNDVPRGWVMKDDAILEFASVMPKTEKEAGKLRNYHNKKPAKTREIIDVIENAKKLKVPEVKKRRSLPKGVAPLAELLKILLRRQCDWHDVAPSIVASMEDVEAIALDADPENNPEIACMHGWRYDVFGKYAVMLKRGELALSAQGRKIVLIEPEYGE